MPDEENTNNELIGFDTEGTVDRRDDGRTFLFLHKSIRRFRVGKFEFKKNQLRLNAEEREEFLRILNEPGFPKAEAMQIVEVNEEAKAASERSVLTNPQGSTVVRGAQNASEILTAKDHQRIAQQQSKPQQGGGSLNPTPTGPKPTFDIAGLNLNKKPQ
jgi:hypothetical protein